MKLGFVSPHAVIGEPPEHRDYRWAFLNNNMNPFPPLIHETAIIEAFVTVDSGIESSTEVGQRCLIMKHAHVGHDAKIGPYCNLAPGCVIGGYANIGSYVKIGIGASIRPRVTIGDKAIIGAGAVVVKDVPAGETWVGNPAGPIKRNPPVTSIFEDLTKREDDWLVWWESWHPIDQAS